MTLDSGLFEIINYSEEEYREVAKSFIGKSIKTSYGNGFFVRDSFDLKGAIILNIYEEKGFSSDDDNYTIVIKVIKNNGEYDYALFDGSWRKWEYVYRHLYEWVNHEGDV